MFIPSPLIDTEVRSCPYGRAVLQKKIQSGKSTGESILQQVSEKGKAFASPFMLITHSDILYTGRGRGGRTTKTKNHTSEIGQCPKP